MQRKFILYVYFVVKHKANQLLYIIIRNRNWCHNSTFDIQEVEANIQSDIRKSCNRMSNN